MCKICVFAGTTEGRELVEFLSAQRVRITACVATDYGETLLTPAANLTISTGRMTAQEMETLFRREQFDLVIDATHPYASVVTENIVAACAAVEVEYLRLLRTGAALPEGAVFVRDIEEAVAYLDGVQGNILLTTGSKELHRFASLRDFGERVYARVLPMEESLQLCRSAGVKNAHILAMQGPFSREMNLAMLCAVNAGYLVTKDSGTTGGFEEKILAAHEAGAVPVVIGRPAQRTGLTFLQTQELLCRRFGFSKKPKVTIVGIGPGSRRTMTGEVADALAHAECVIGAERMVEAVAACGQTVYHAVAPEKIAAIIRSEHSCQHFVVAMSGDTGFFSGTKKLLPLLTDCAVQVLPGISSFSYLCAKLGTSYEDIVPVSIHGREGSILPMVRTHPRLFALVGGENGMGTLCAELAANGLGHVKISAGDRLSYPDERITLGTAQELQNTPFHSLCAALIENPHADMVVTQGLPDAAFVRTEGVPMTKSEVRAVCLSKLALREDAVCWDVGAGTGSVSVEIARCVQRGHVYAIEQKETAIEVLRKNVQHFGVENLTVVSGSAPEVCAPLPAPTHAFIGGSNGHMKEMIALLLTKNPQVRIVATAVTLESIGELTACMKAFRFSQTEVVSMSIARDKTLGAYHLMGGQNPVYLFTMQGGML